MKMHQKLNIELPDDAIITLLGIFKRIEHTMSVAALFTIVQG